MVHMQETDSSNAFPLSNSIGDTYSHFELSVPPPPFFFYIPLLLKAG